MAYQSFIHTGQDVRNGRLLKELAEWKKTCVEKGYTIITEIFPNGDAIIYSAVQRK